MKAKRGKKQELTLEEIEGRYVGEWVLVEETAWDEQGNPKKGVVFAHGLDRALRDDSRANHQTTYAETRGQDLCLLRRSQGP